MVGKFLIINKKRMKFIITGFFLIISLGFCTGIQANEKYKSTMKMSKRSIKKENIQEDGIVRLSKVEVYPEHLEEYMKFAVEVGEISLLTEPGVITMYAMADNENPNLITILETYSSQEAYQKHIASEHFQKYKKGTLHMVKNLKLEDQNPLNPRNKLIDYIEE